MTIVSKALFEIGFRQTQMGRFFVTRSLQRACADFLACCAWGLLVAVTVVQIALPLPAIAIVADDFEDVEEESEPGQEEGGGLVELGPSSPRSGSKVRLGSAWLVAMPARQPRPLLAGLVRSELVRRNGVGGPLRC